MDIRPAPPADAAASHPAPAKEVPTEALKDAPKNKDNQPAVPKQRGSNVSLAIAATVVIVLSLATLATYAFIKTRS